ncbi:radical SAM protein [Patescibacteria group bacterium]|nr:radical SAM protein [Patescibacteria group bacterium]
MKPFPEIVSFRITSKCNNNCKYCYGPPQNLEEMNFLKLKKLFHLFSQNGVKAIVLCGGEPLVRGDFEDIIKELRKYNFKIFLDTNGDLFFKYSDLILKNVDVIGLPIDFPNKSYRNSDNLDNILRILNFFKEKPKKPIIRIGTVVTKDNIDKLEKIGDLIKDYPIDIWKIYEFIPQNVNAVKNKSLLEVLPEQFDEATQKIKDKFSKYFKIAISKRKDRTNAYFFVASNGNVFMPVDDFNLCREVEIGNVFDENIVEKWKKFISENNYIDNAKATFNYKF